MIPDRVAQCAVLAMLIELSSSPKPGNVDRCHDFPDLGFHHFLTSAISAYPIFRRAAVGQEGVGSLILEAVSAWQTWNLSSNTHFGSLVLMMPVAIAAGRQREPCIDIKNEISDVLEKTTVQDSLDFYRAFEIANARVIEVDCFSLKDEGWQEAICESNKTLQELMKLSAGHDIVAHEWSTKYERSFKVADRMAGQIKQYGLNEGVVRTYLEALAEIPDSLICAKYGDETGHEVSRLAAQALCDASLKIAHELDRDLLARDINPGSTADLIAASLFITLLRGLRF